MDCRGAQRLTRVAKHILIPAGSSGASDTKDPALPAPPVPPTAWKHADWHSAGERQARYPLLDMVAIERMFDRDAFLRDGFAVFPAVMADPARWAGSIREVQSLNDAFCVSDWGDIDWQRIRDADVNAGLPDWGVPSVPHVELRAQAVGKSQTLPRCMGPARSAAAGWQLDRADRDPGGLQRLRRHGLIPEYFPCGFHDYLMEALYHPQMLALQSLLFGTGVPFKFDHSQVITREPGYQGGNWHNHFNGGPSDDAGPCMDPRAYGRQRNVIFLFAYPDGFRATDEGGLKVVAGSHLHRDVTHCRGGRTDEEFSTGWMSGKTHPATGETLSITRLALPSGSLVAAFAHLAHGVDSRGEQQPPRSANLWCYREQREGDKTPFSRSSANIPPHLQERALRGELPAELASLIVGVQSGY
eukprot:SAG11_NODE_1952_length_4011_cov_3.936605_6_plen_415_part_00